MYWKLSHHLSISASFVSSSRWNCRVVSQWKLTYPFCRQCQRKSRFKSSNFVITYRRNCLRYQNLIRKTVCGKYQFKYQKWTKEEGRRSNNSKTTSFLAINETDTRRIKANPLKSIKTHILYQSIETMTWNVPSAAC